MPRPKPSSLTRRRLLTSLGGGAIALPFLRSFSVDAGQGKSALPRVLFVGFPNGPLVGPHGGEGYAGWRPANASGFESALPHAAGDFPEIFGPLRPFRDRLVFIENLAYIDGGNEHRHTSALLTGRRKHVDGDNADYTSTGISVDHWLAEQFADDPDRATEVLNTAFNITADAPGEAYWSYTGPQARAEPIQDPLNTFERVFGSGVDPIAHERFVARRGSVLDVIARDLGRLMDRVPAADRPRLQQHLEGVRDLERSLEAPLCDGGDAPGSYDPLASPNAPRVFADHAEVIAQAFACGFSRIATLQFGHFGGGRTRPQWPELGIDYGGHSDHAISHAFAEHVGAGSEGLLTEDARGLGIAKEIAYSRMFSDVLARLDAVPDIGGGTLLDNTLVVYVRPMGENHDSDRVLWIAAGGAGVGVEGGRWLTLPPSQRHFNDVLTAVCHSMGEPVDTFGEPEFCAEPIPLG